MIKVFFVFFFYAVASSSSRADDGAAEVGLGGIEFKKTDAISMEKEELFLSLKQVRVKFKFKNITEHDVKTTVAFPIPEYSSDPYGCEYSDNTGCGKADRIRQSVSGFFVKVDGKNVIFKSEMKALVDGKEVTEALNQYKIPVDQPEKVMAAISAVSHEKKKELIEKKLIISEIREETGNWIPTKEVQPDGGHWKQEPNKNLEHIDTNWTISRKYYWEQIFPAGKTITIEHTYSPVSGGTSVVTPGEYDKEYCIDSAAKKAIEKNCKGTSCGGGMLEYILTSANTWAGPIKDFTMQIEKPDTDTIVSLCFDGIKKIGPKTFQSHLINFIPTNEVKIIFISLPKKSK